MDHEDTYNGAILDGVLIVTITTRGSIKQTYLEQVDEKAIWYAEVLFGSQEIDF